MSRPARGFRATQTPKEISIDTQKQQEARPESPASSFYFTNSSKIISPFCPLSFHFFVPLLRKSVNFVKYILYNYLKKT